MSDLKRPPADHVLRRTLSGSPKRWETDREKLVRTSGERVTRQKARTNAKKK
jgi:hypothetical protein